METPQGAGPGCHVGEAESYLRVDVGADLPPEAIDECYRKLAVRALEEKVTRVLVVGLGESHAHSHLAARDALVALAELGVPSGFKIALVPRSDATLNGYRHAELEGRSRGMRVQVFPSEEEAVGWLTGPDFH